MCLTSVTEAFDQAAQPKHLNAQLRLQALIAAEMNSSRVAEFPNLEPGVKALLDMNAKLFAEIAR